VVLSPTAAHISLNFTCFRTAVYGTRGIWPTVRAFDYLLLLYHRALTGTTIPVTLVGSVVRTSRAIATAVLKLIVIPRLAASDMFQRPCPIAYRDRLGTKEDSVELHKCPLQLPSVNSTLAVQSSFLVTLHIDLPRFPEERLTI
jgi:hypothetical protein